MGGYEFEDHHRQHLREKQPLCLCIGHRVRDNFHCCVAYSWGAGVEGDLRWLSQELIDGPDTRRVRNRTHSGGVHYEVYC